MGLSCRIATIICMGIFLLIAPFAAGAGETEEKHSQQAEESRKSGKEMEPKKEKETEEQVRLIYEPPFRGAPTGRIGGGSRGTGEDEQNLFITALVPDHTGLTTKARPVLYWYLSEPTKRNILFTLNDEKAGETLLQIPLETTGKSGILKIDLSEMSVELKPENDYSWFVTAVTAPDRPAEDMITGGFIRRVLPADELKEKYENLPEERKAAIYARAGIWYDAFAALSRRIENQPEDKTLRCRRKELLKQVGLVEVTE